MNVEEWTITINVAAEVVSIIFRKKFSGRMKLNREGVF